MEYGAIKLLTSESGFEDIERLAGNKGKSLYLLGNNGVSVPPWIILGTDVFKCYRETAGIDKVIAGLLQNFSADNAADIAAQIQSAVLSTPLPETVGTLVKNALTSLGEGPVAIRSSGKEEDSKEFSFAGQFDTYLGIEGLDDILLHVQKCWASVYSERSLLYRHRHNLGFANVDIAVILQRLITADLSGVVFTVNPASGSADELVISAVYGLGEGLVSGLVDADTVVVDKRNGALISQVIGEKAQQVGPNGNISDVPAEAQQQLSLSSENIQAICASAKQIELNFKAPQDIEWCLQEGHLWILQARPVTAFKEEPKGDFQIWDNSNIIENYPGTVSPLTFTFTQNLYSKVFREYCRLLRIPEKQLKEMDGFLGSVLGYMNGRAYYNLLHWYKLVGTSPFYNLGHKMLEVQMGLDESLDLAACQEKIKPYQTDSRLEYLWIRALSGLMFFWYFFTLKRQVRKFRAAFYQLYGTFNAIDYRELPADRIYACSKQFEQAIIAHWGIMISLESSIGLPYGLLRLLIRRWLPDAPDWLEVAVIGGIHDMESMGPALEMAELASYARQNPEWERIISQTPAKQCSQALAEAGADAFLAQVDAYIAAYGYRSNNELKLEEPDLREEPGVLFDMLKVALATGAREQNASAAHERDLKALLDKGLNPVQRLLFNIVLGKVQSAIQARETVRFCRSRTFGVFRNMYRAIGNDFARHGLFEDGRDIFDLRLEELKGCFEGTISTREIKPLILQRKADMDVYRTMKALPPRFVTFGSVFGWLQKWSNTDSEQHESHAADDDSRELRGTPCSPGFVEGRVQIVQEPGEFTGGILAAYRTDPGWVAVFPFAEALLIERGSPLTHAAIVAREVGLPTIVQIPKLTQMLKSGMMIRVDGHSGTVTILD